MLEIKGKLVKIIFHNDQNSYTVGLLRVKESDNKELVNKNNCVNDNFSINGHKEVVITFNKNSKDITIK